MEEKTECTENIPVSVTLSTKNPHKNQSVRMNPHLTQYEVSDCESELHVYHGPLVLVLCTAYVMWFGMFIKRRPRVLQIKFTGKIL